MSTYDKLASQYPRTLIYLTSIPHDELARLALDLAFDLIDEGTTTGQRQIPTDELLVLEFESSHLATLEEMAQGNPEKKIRLLSILMETKEQKELIQLTEKEIAKDPMAFFMEDEPFNPYKEKK